MVRKDIFEIEDTDYPSEESGKLLSKIERLILASDINDFSKLLRKCKGVIMQYSSIDHIIILKMGKNTDRQIITLDEYLNLKESDTTIIGSRKRVLDSQNTSFAKIDDTEEDNKKKIKALEYAKRCSEDFNIDIDSSQIMMTLFDRLSNPSYKLIFGINKDTTCANEFSELGLEHVRYLIQLTYSRFLREKTQDILPEHVRDVYHDSSLSFTTLLGKPEVMLSRLDKLKELVSKDTNKALEELEKLKRDVSYIQANATEIHDSFEDIHKLALSRDKKQISFENAKVFETLERMILNKFRGKAMRLTNNLKQGTQVKLYEPYFERIIENLISNALKYIPKEGDVRIGIDQELTNMLNGKGVTFYVSDTGQGVTESDFYNQEKARRESKNNAYGFIVPTCGRGLKSVVNMLSAIAEIKGERFSYLFYKSVAGKGSTFYFNI